VIEDRIQMPDLRREGERSATFELRMRRLFLRLLVLLAFGFVWCAAPIDAHATWPRIDQGAYVVGTAVALPQNSLSLLNNPAGLAIQDHFEARAQATIGGSDGMAARGGGLGLMAGLPFGPFGIAAALEHVRDPAPGAEFGPGIGEFSRLSGGGGITFDRWFHAGAAVRLHTSQAPQIGTLLTMDVGLLLVPWKWFSMGARVSDMVGATSFLLPDTIGGITGPQYAWGWALRYEEKFKWSVDIGWPSIAPITQFTTSLSAKLNKQYELAAEYQHTVHNAVITGHATGSDVRVAVVLRWTGSWYGAEVGAMRDLPEGDARASGAVMGARVVLPFKVPIWHKAMALLGVGEAGRLAARTKKPRAKAPEKKLSIAEVRDHNRRARLGWQAPLKGAYRREALKVSAAVRAFSSAMAKEQADQLCGLLAGGRLRFDIATLDPPLNIHRNLENAAACLSLKSGALAKYIKEFGPSHPHADMSTVVPALFAVHGSPFLHLSRVQLSAYGQAIRGQHGRQERLGCSTYKAARLPADAATPAKQRRYEVTIGCDAVANYHIEVMGNRTLGFKIRKFSMRRLRPPQ
jgi:hypothetical protein